MPKRDSLAILMSVDKIKEIREYLGYGVRHDMYPHMTVAVMYH